MPGMHGIATFFLAYLFGTLSWSYIAVRVRLGDDLRNYGSGNLGATNAGRVLGKLWAILIYLADMMKGFLPVWIAQRIDGPEMAGPPLTVLAGFGVILGHLYPFWLSFRGGKGVATGSGVVLALSPLTAVASVGVWYLTLKVSRYVSLASVVATLSLPVAFWFLVPASRASRTWETGLLAAVAIIVVIAHRANLKRIVDGSEKKVGIPT